jgi:hypothetical protein
MKSYLSSLVRDAIVRRARGYKWQFLIIRLSCCPS